MIIKFILPIFIVILIILALPQKRGIPQMPASMNINKGGCGYFAKYLHRKYSKSEIVHFYTKAHSRVHIMLYFPQTGEYADCEGFTKYPRWLIFKKKVISEQELDSFLAMPGWNRKFKKSDTTIMKKAIFSTLF